MTDTKHGHAVFTASAGRGRYRLTALVAAAGNDLVVSIIGGDRPHVGAVAAAYCTPSAGNGKRPAVSASIITLPGHREDEIVRTAALKLAKRFGVSVAVSAGMHWDVISGQGIAAVLKNADLLSGRIISTLERMKSLIQPCRGRRIPDEKR